MLHSENEFGRADVIKIECFVVISRYFAAVINHLARISLQIIQNIIASVGLISVEHALKFYAHDITPAGFRCKVEQIGLRGAFHFRKSHPLCHAFEGFVFGSKHELAVHLHVFKSYMTCLARNLDVFLADTIETAVLQTYVCHVLHAVSSYNKHAVSTLLARDVLHIHVSHHRFEAAITRLFGLVIEVNLHYGLLTLPHFDASHVDIFDQTAATIVGFYA